MKVKDIMTRDVAYINPTASITDAALIMQKNNVGSIPVCDSNGVVGIVTDRDIVVRNVAHGNNPQTSKVSDVMTSNITSVSPDMDIDVVSSIMSKEQVRRLPVVENNKLIGIVALGDMAINPNIDTEVSAALTEISKPTKPSNY